jgi:hypothetical protein
VTSPKKEQDMHVAGKEYLSKKTILNVGFEILTAVIMTSSVFWDIMPRSALKVNLRFGRTGSLHLQDRRIS